MIPSELTPLVTRWNAMLAQRAETVTTYRELQTGIDHAFCLRHAAEFMQWLESRGTTGQACELCLVELEARGETR